MRDHQPAPISTFNGYFDRGDVENTPLDHFQGSANIRHQGKSVMTRDGITPSQDVNAVTPLTNIKRVYNYATITKNTQIVLSYDPNTNTGHIYHVVDSTHQFGPVLSIVGMLDFAFVPFGGRAYISPFASLPPSVNSPISAPSTIPHSGTGVDLGLHSYAYTFVLSAEETTPSPLSSATTFLGLSTPTVAPNYGAIPTGVNGANNLTLGALYTWKFTYIDAAGNETDPGTTSPGLFLGGGGSDNTLKIMLNNNGVAFPAAVTTVNVYRTLGGGSTYHLEVQNVPVSSLVGSGTSGILVGILTDTLLFSKPIAPGSNSSVTCEKVQLSNILVGPTGTTARKIYRTAVGSTQLKLLTTIADNTTTSFLDAVADASLGANAPTVNTAILAGDNVERGLQGEFLYVYAGDGTAARKAAGAAITGSMTVAAGAPGNVDAGLHVYGVVSETESGYLSPPGALTTFTNIATNSVSFGNIPTSGDPTVIARHIVASKAITTFNGNLEGYDMFFIPNAVINNNTDTFLNNVEFFDIDLLKDASHLFDNFSEIAAGAFLTLYHGRLVLGCTYEDINIVLISQNGEPEAISQIDGLLATQPNGFPVSNAAEFRDVLYVFRPNSGMSFTDNGDVPSSWPLTTLEAALGARPHAICQYLNSETQSIDFLIIGTYQGISLFTGGFQAPELSWKIENFYKSLDRKSFGLMQIICNTVKKRLYVVLPDRTLLVGSFQNGLDPTSIQWEPWVCVQPINTIAVTGIDEDIIGSDIY